MSGENNEIAEVFLACGRYVLFVADIAVAMEGDKCRHQLPEEVASPIPQSELERSYVGETKCSEMPIDVVRFFRGDMWTKASLDWAAKTINETNNKA